MVGHHSWKTFVTSQTGGVPLCLEVHYLLPVAKGMGGIWGKMVKGICGERVWGGRRLCGRFIPIDCLLLIGHNKYNFP